MKIALFDYGVGNLHSLGKALERAGSEVVVTRDWQEAISCDGLVLPGVGAFSAAVEALPEDRTPLRAALEAGLPCLGICLGMQIMFESSEEGPGEGIGIVPGRVRKLRARIVPQMGWNAVETLDRPIFADMPPPPGASPHEDGLTAYFANSYVCEPADEADAVGWSTHDGDRFVSAVVRGNTWGCQFHPEKSSAQGAAIIRNFVRMVGERVGEATAASDAATGRTSGAPSRDGTAATGGAS